jgi:hypothetical protein
VPEGESVMWIYRVMDILGTLGDVIALGFIMTGICKENRNKYVKYLPCVLFFCFVYMWTWLIRDQTFKMPAIIIAGTIFIKLCYRDTWFNSIICMFLLYTEIILGESIAGGILSHFFDPLTVKIGNEIFMRWQTYFGFFIVMILLSFGISRLFRNFQYETTLKDFILIFVSYIFLIIVFLDDITIKSGNYNLEHHIMSSVLAIIFTVQLLYIKNYTLLKKVEQQEQFTINRMNEQFCYYREKEEDEKRVRALYHDMKNHLLILEKQNSQEVKQMAADLRRQISDYEDYVHTGNDFLDVIIRDKVKKAKEQGIDFLAVIDFTAGDFIEPLDISTIFGNALDNALEASVKLPPEQRLITVKAGCNHDMLMIVFENNAVMGKMKGTSKEDEFLHGFGIPNIRKAVEKYNGECVIRQENGMFVMKHIIPLPEI